MLICLQQIAVLHVIFMRCTMEELGLKPVVGSPQNHAFEPVNWFCNVKQAGVLQSLS
jgi:hypothetical protein